MKISQAPPAEDVNWFRMKFEDKTAVIMTIVGLVLGLIFVSIAVDVVEVFQEWRVLEGKANVNFNSQGSAVNSTVQAVVSLFVGSILVMLGKWILKLFIERSSRNSRFRTHSNLLSARMVLKMVLYFLFFVMAGSVLSEYISFSQKSWD
jgi:hypothetical protein